MHEKVNKSPEFDLAEPDFSKQIEMITARKLNVQNLNTYAEDALDELIRVISRITSQYNRQPTVARETEREHEDTALAYFGIDSNYINTLLDYIAQKADEIRNLDTISRITAHRIDAVIVPPDSNGVTMQAGDGSFEKRSEPRLNTLLFLLTNGFKLDLESPTEFIHTEGLVGTTEFRDESYHMVELPSLDRIVLVCDEVGNATFVLDSVKLNDLGIEPAILITYSKKKLDALFDGNVKLGMRLVSSPSFVEDMAALLQDIPESDDKLVPADERVVELLRPDNTLSAPAVAQSINEQYGTRVSHKRFTRLARR